MPSTEQHVNFHPKTFSVWTTLNIWRGVKVSRAYRDCLFAVQNKGESNFVCCCKEAVSVHFVLVLE